MIPRCGCEMGGDCTLTSVCSVETAVEDAKAECAEEMVAVLEKIGEQQQEIERLRAVVNTERLVRKRVHSLIKEGRYHAADAELAALGGDDE